MVQTVNSVREPYSFGSRTELTVQKNGIRQQRRMHSSINKNAILVVNLNRRLTTVSSVSSVPKTKTLCLRVSAFQIICPLLTFCKNVYSAFREFCISVRGVQDGEKYAKEIAFIFQLPYWYIGD